MNESTLRTSLWLACAFNLTAALVFVLPSSAIGDYFGLPSSVSPIYLSLVGLFVGLFGLTYGWLARQSVIDRPLLFLGAIGKCGACLIAVALWLRAEVSARIALVSLGDLALAVLWLTWLVGGGGSRER